MLTFAKPAAMTSWRVGPPLVALLFLLTYFEPVSIAGIKFSILWRAIIILPILAFLLLGSSKTVVPLRPLRLIGIAWACYTLAPVLSYVLGGTPLSEAIPFFAQRLLPFLVVWFLFIAPIHIQVDAFIRSIPFALCIVSPLFLLNIVEPTGHTLTLDFLGSTSAKAYIGSFQNQHSAVFIHAIGTLIAWDVFSKRRNTSGWYYFAACVGCAILATLTTARAGIGGMLVGMFVISVTYRDFKRIWLFVTLPIVAAIYLIVAQPALLEIVTHRLFGLTIWQTNIDVESFTSGRSLLQSAAIYAYFKLDLVYQLFGVGFKGTADAIGQYSGLYLMAHNLVLDELLRYGMFGLLSLAISLMAVFGIAWRNARAGFPLGLALWILSVVFSMFQSLDYSLQLSIVGLVVAMEHIGIHLNRMGTVPQLSTAGAAIHGRSFRLQ